MKAPPIRLLIADGALGYVSKTEGQESLVAAIRSVARGRRIFSARARLRLAERRNLSNCELDVLTGMSHGLTNKETAINLGTSEHTVKSYVLSFSQP
ncbi:MAG: LuxR C-terminal-related transcriptional regulator [Akkermansiaceae bacterium]|nr:LuxR C-terminal-related transcriptional regulator [Akkermansiaceae bacterium]